MGLYERAEEVLAPADRSLFGATRGIDRIHVRFGGCAIYLYALLGREQGAAVRIVSREQSAVSREPRAGNRGQGQGFG